MNITDLDLNLIVVLDAMFEEVGRCMATLEHPAVVALIQAYLQDEELMARFKSAPAAMTLHHAFIGGLPRMPPALPTRAAASLSRLGCSPAAAIAARKKPEASMSDPTEAAAAATIAVRRPSALTAMRCRALPTASSIDAVSALRPVLAAAPSPTTAGVRSSGRLDSSGGRCC